MQRYVARSVVTRYAGAIVYVTATVGFALWQRPVVLASAGGLSLVANLIAPSTSSVISLERSQTFTPAASKARRIFLICVWPMPSVLRISEAVAALTISTCPFWPSLTRALCTCWRFGDLADRLLLIGMLSNVPGPGLIFNEQPKIKE